MSFDFSFSADELQGMREEQTGHMLDQCQILVYAEGTRNEFNEDDAPTYTAGASLACGLEMVSDMRTSARRFNEEMTVIQYDAVLRLPLHTPVTEKDHIRMISRFGEAIDPLDYEIMSPIVRGPSGVRLMLRKVVT